jgi:hypothetical protein
VLAAQAGLQIGVVSQEERIPHIEQDGFKH